MKAPITVRAKDPAKPCPMEARKRVRLYEHAPGELRDRHSIYHDAPIEVPDSRYYRRRIAAGDLERVDARAPVERPPRSSSSSKPKPNKSEAKQ